jgi:hypothetical protein
MRMKASPATVVALLLALNPHVFASAEVQTPAGVSGESLAPAAESVKGTLCFLSGGKLVGCVGTSGTTLHAAPAETARPFVWTSDDGSRVAVGRLDAKGDTIDLAAKQWHNAALRVAGDPSHGWPLETTFRVTTPEHDEWSWPLPAKTIKRFATLTLPPGRYALTVSAEHHRPAARRFDVSEGDAKVSIGDVTLAPLVVVSAVVVTHHEDREVPLSGVTVTASYIPKPGVRDTRLLATAGDDGRIRAEMPLAFGEITLLFAHPGYATKSMTVSVQPGDKDFGRVLLLPGTTLKVHVVRPDLEERKLTVDLRRQDEKYEKTELGSRTLGPHEDDLVFENLAPAEHVVVVNGTAPLEHIARSIAIKEGKPETMEIEIKPFTLDGHVRYGGEALTEGSVGLSQPSVWRAEVPLDGMGHFGGTMWQHDSFSTYVQNRPLFGTPYFTQSPALGDSDPTAWTIDVPKRLLAGRVLDAETKEPLPKVSLEARAIFQDGTFDSNVQIAPDGGYHVLVIKPGDWSLLATAEGYVPENPHFQIAEGDGSKDYDLLLSHGITQTLELTWPDGTPVTSADVLEGSLGRGLFHQRLRSDLGGHVTVRGQAGATQTVFVSPREGSLAVVHVTFGRDDGKPLPVTVPRPVGTLRVQTVDEAGAPVWANCLLRWNGEILLPDTLMHHAGDVPSRIKGEQEYFRVPAGVYEVWPVAYGQNVPPLQQPGRVDLASGEAAVKVVMPSKAH